MNGAGAKLEFDCPRDICYSKKCFYVLDQGAFSVDKFTHKGDFIESFKFNEHEELIVNPWSIRVNKDIMAIVDWKQKILIFDNEKKLKFTIDQPFIESICFICSGYSDSCQLFAHSDNGDLKGYEFVEELEPSMIFHENSPRLKYRSEFMIYGSNQKFIISLGWSKAMAIVDLINTF